MKPIIIFYVLFFLMACSSVEQKNEEVPIPSEEMSQNHETDFSDTLAAESDTVIINRKLGFSEKLTAFRSKYSRWYSDGGVPSGILPDRFISDSVIRFRMRKLEQVNYGTEIKVYPEFSFYAFRYSDTASYENALFNWFNCFGSDCASVKEGESVKAIKTPPSFTLYGYPYIIHISWPCEHAENNWDEITSEVKSLFGGQGTRTIQVKCGGPLNWN
jgi:hypothetical protein